MDWSKLTRINKYPRRRKILIDIRLQGTIIIYFVVFYAASILVLYVGLTWTLAGVDAVLISQSRRPQDLREWSNLRESIVSSFFISYAIVTIVLAIIGGLYLSHRIAGPIYRLRVALNQLLEGKAVSPSRLRTHDFFSDLVEIAKKLADKNSKGFSLLELMIIVGLVAILGTIASVEFHHFVGKARQSEAKAALSSVLQVEKVFYIEANSYTMCLRQIGLVPDQVQRYYAFGFAYSASVPSTTAPACDGFPCIYYDFAGAGQHCSPGPPTASPMLPLNTSDIAYYNSVMATPATPFPSDVSSFTSMTTSQFTCAALGNLFGATWDIWTIDQDQNLINNRIGF